MFMIGELIFFPFFAVFMLLMIIIGVLAFLFWIWMIVDCAKRNFKNDAEKIVWIIIVVLASWVGALIYYFVIKTSNEKGLSKKK